MWNLLEEKYFSITKVHESRKFVIESKNRMRNIETSGELESGEKI
jgi:hypothetical protein